jgi:ABC-type multidrug transport system fused ATPase/permease subunit
VTGQADEPRHSTTFWRLLGFLSPYKLSLVFSIVLAIISQLGSLAFPALTGLVVKAIEDDDKGAIPWLIGAVIAVGIVKAAAQVGRRLISGWQALGVDFDLRNALYAKLVRRGSAVR